MKIDKIPEDAVRIAGTVDEYIDRQGNVYGYDHRAGHKCLPFLREQQTVYGYKYTKIRGVPTRVHRVVAETFIPNPDNLPIVMHINNDKSDNRVENLKWGTISDNTKQAVNDGLMVNAKGADDSQSIPCDMYDTTTNKLVASYGSIKEATRATGISTPTICSQIKHELPIRKPFYFTRKGEGSRSHDIVIATDINTGKEVGRFPNTGRASAATGVPQQTVAEQCNNSKRNWSKSGLKFSRVFLKGEEVIERDKQVE